MTCQALDRNGCLTCVQCKVSACSLHCAVQANGNHIPAAVVHFAPCNQPPTPPGTVSLRAKSDKLSRRCSNLEDACLLDIKSCTSLARADTSCTLSTWRGLAPYASKLGALSARAPHPGDSNR
jgi:hypothetical protein